MYLLSIVSEAINNVFFLFGYVSNGSAYPQPLAPEEETRYFEMYRNGNDEARNALIERNLRLVASLVNKRYGSLRDDMEDLYSVGTIGLVKAVDTFDHTRNIRFATYAAKCINNEILMHIRASAKSKKEISLQETIDIDGEGNETILMDTLAADTIPVAENAESNILKKWLYSKVETILKGQEKKVLIPRYGLYNREDKTQQEIAGMLGISRSYVSRIENRAVNKLMKEYNRHSFNE